MPAWSRASAPVAVAAEAGPAAEVYARPAHPYTRMLLDSTLVADPKAQARRSAARRSLPRSEPPSPLNPPPGCPFQTRCAWANERCRTEAPPLVPWDGRLRRAACHRLEEVNA